MDIHLFRRDPWRARLMALCAGSVVGLAGCASTPPPNEKLALAREAVQRAERAQAVEHAPVLLRDARDKLSEAERLAERREKEAGWMAEKAQADATLAEATARRAVSTRMANETDATIRALREETLRGVERSTVPASGGAPATSPAIPPAVAPRPDSMRPAGVPMT